MMTASLSFEDTTIPAELKALPHWVCWRAEPNGERIEKIPVRAATGNNASTTDPQAWTDYTSAAMAASTQEGLGIGFVFHPEAGIVGVDLDKCRNPETGHLEPWAEEIVRDLNSYAEVSPSRTGVHIFVRATLPPGKRKKGKVEAYGHGRFFTVTGAHVDGTPCTIEDRAGELAAFHAHYLADPQAEVACQPTNRHVSPVLSDDDILAKCRTARNAAKFEALWRGDITGYASHSEADLALMSLLSFYTQDESQLDQLYRQSGLRREKWDERHGERTYGALTIAKALANVRETYSPRRIEDATTDATQADHWPRLDERALHGIIGDLVRAIEPHSEADPVALLVQALIAYGNTLNRAPYFQAEADRHHMNLNAVAVGETSKGRKGTSWGYVRRVFAAVDPDWASTRILNGLSSGEGLIWAVRDEIVKEEPVREKGRPTGEYQTVVVDRGVTDKRLLVLESEFASTLRVMSRDGNTLSAVIRQAWDSGDLRTMTKNCPAQATGAHISIIAHITKDELCRLMEATEASNGFCNRFLWVCVKRSKALPEGGLFDEATLAPIVQRLHAAIRFGRSAGEIKRDEGARDIWRAVYPSLSEGKPGLLGAVISRGEAQVMRLACLYALQDMSYVVRPDHLTAALALWEYCEASAKYIFGQRLGDPIADELLSALRKHCDGMTRTEIRDWFGRNRKAYEIDRGLTLLAKQGLARMQEEQSGGRPIERWFAVLGGTT